MITLVKVFNIPRGACIPFYEKKVSPLSVPESQSPTHVPVSRNIHFRLVLDISQFAWLNVNGDKLGLSLTRYVGRSILVGR
jgi:hypothetical protein